ncbi:hypothetical protein FSP39_018780 [Pinctada imbricata]|uniref:SSD domain-containing protein n=1 Tax=Pinctada imbricata TaxID=66713 RepID=A0AA88YIY9_PINIB|nr:hypothetical protein FSP39_018780 [Pinctada imbricata]
MCDPSGDSLDAAIVLVRELIQKRGKKGTGNLENVSNSSQCPQRQDNAGSIELNYTHINNSIDEIHYPTRSNGTPLDYSDSDHVDSYIATGQRLITDFKDTQNGPISRSGNGNSDIDSFLLTNIDDDDQVATALSKDGIIDDGIVLPNDEFDLDDPKVDKIVIPPEDYDLDSNSDDLNEEKINLLINHVNDKSVNLQEKEDNIKEVPPSKHKQTECTCHKRYEDFIGHLFGKLGAFLARDRKTPWIVLGVCVCVNIGLMFGLLKFEYFSNSEKLYTPRGSEASINRDELLRRFPKEDNVHFLEHELTDFGLYGEVIFYARNKENILNETIVSYIRDVDQFIRNNITIVHEGKHYNFSDICARDITDECSVSGDFIFQNFFKLHLQNLTYPTFYNIRLSVIFGGMAVKDNKLVSATHVRLRYHLRDDVHTFSGLSEDWEKEFLNRISEFSHEHLDFAYVNSNSMNTELDSNIIGAIQYFAVTVFLMFLYSCVASIGWNVNCIAWRPMLSIGGILATVLAIGSACGITSLVGIEFISMHSAFPFLIIGIGIDDMFILMSAMSDACSIPSPSGKPEATTQEKLYYALKASGVAITITSLTNFLSFAIGSSGAFLSVEYFCITTGLAIVFCYVNQLFIFVPCIVINEHRMDSGRHFCHCRKILHIHKHSNHSKHTRMCCAGAVPKHRNDYDGPLEKFPKILIKSIVREIPCKIIIVILFCVYLAFSILGALRLKEGLELKNLANTDSYYYKHSDVFDKHFRQDLPITIVFPSTLPYHQHETRNKIKDLITESQKSKYIIDDFEISWLFSFEKTPLYDNSSKEAFIQSLKTFLDHGGQIFKNEIRFNDEDTDIIASRMYILSDDTKETEKHNALMSDTRQFALDSGLQVFVFSPFYIFFETLAQIFSSTLKTVGIATAVMVVITTIFMPQPALIVFVFISMVMILTGMFGFMYYWNLELNPVTMVCLIMTVGFSVDFSAHICHAYLSVSVETNDESVRKCCFPSSKNHREIRVGKAIDRSGGPIINAALSSIVGVLMLTLYSSYIFQAFLKLMLLVIVFGLAHAIFFLPAILSLAGPISETHEEKPKKESEEIPSFSKALAYRPKYMNVRLPRVHNIKYLQDERVHGEEADTYSSVPVLTFDQYLGVFIYRYLPK